MKYTAYTSAKRTQCQYERDERMRAGVPPVGHDWQCYICGKWYSKYRGRNLLHLQHCEAKDAKRIAREEKRNAQMVPLPSPDRFSPGYESAPDAASMIPRSPIREPSVLGDAEQDSEYPEGSLEYFGNDPPEPPVLDQALGDDGNLGEFNIISNSQRAYTYLPPYLCQTEENRTNRPFLSVVLPETQRLGRSRSGKP